MVKYDYHWNLTVIQNWEKKSDIYKFKDRSLTFEYSQHNQTRKVNQVCATWQG